ncbi:hypothetical protein C6P46_000341 [Rhodotorula mucilaginosa]|uniref:Uncharacterized protein n=1 Tax=Rhodotorula mucilaginosa TaxID=5537 RepID=A0A9P6VWS0_RHOMI|nr:hypothetical protein C6P46_000341 [Rhodotorula mucilaginosa]
MAADYSHLLPPPVLDRILETAFHTTDADSDRFPPPVQLTTLASLGKAINASVRRILAREVVLQDDDNRLVDAEEGQSAVLLARVVNDPNWANDVKLLTVVNPVFDQASDPALCHPPPPPPLDDAAFFLCLSRFETLSSFTWHSHRIPPELLCLALGQAAKNLTNFKLELVPLPLSGGTTTTDAAAPPSSPPLQQHQSPTSASGLYSPLLHGSGVGNGTATSAAASAPAPRWDAPHLASLPAKLTHLSLSNLSSLGAQSLAEHALPALPMLEFVQLEKTLWVDDHVLEAMGRHLKGLGVLKVREMAGTKLSENGLGEVLRGCPELRELHLDCVQGRFSRACWQKLTPLPSNLRVLRLSYSEQGPHKSWLLDHLASLSHLVDASNSELEHLALTRIVAGDGKGKALVPGSHHLARYPIDPVLDPRSLTLGEKDLDALVGVGGGGNEGGGEGGGGREWRKLELDLFRIEQDQLKRILEGCTKLKSLKVMFDAPFRNLLTLAPSFAACPELQHLEVAIPPGHSPEMASVTPAEYFAAVAPVFVSSAGASESGTAAEAARESGQPEQSPRPQHHGHGRRASLATSAGSPTRTRTNASFIANNDAVAPEGPTVPIDLAALDKAATATARNCVHHPLEALDSLLPVTKDWRRFLKKAHALERIAWTGRGGLGTWEFGQKQGSSLARVEFRPTKPVVVGEGETALSGGDQSPTRSRTRTASSSGGGGGFGGPESSSSSWGWDGQLASPSAYTSSSSSRRRSSSVSLAGSCLSNLSLSPTLQPQPVQRSHGGGDGSHSVFSSPATPFSTLMGLGIPSSSTAIKSNGNAAGGMMGDVPCSPPEYQHGFGNGSGNGGRRRSSASSSAMFGAIGANFLASPPQHDNSAGGGNSSALGLSMPLYEEETSFNVPSTLSSSHVQDLFGWAAETAAATATATAPPRGADSSSSPSGRAGGKGAPSSSKASNHKSLPAIQTTTTTPKASSLLPPAPAHLPAKPLSFAAAAASAAAAKVVNTSTTGATAPAMARTASATSASSAISTGGGGGSSSKSAGSSPTQSPGRSTASGGGGGSKAGNGRSGGGGGGRSNRSRGKSASPKQEKNASLPPSGPAGGENRRASGGGSGAGGGNARKSGGGGGGGGRRREATR